MSRPSPPFPRAGALPLLRAATVIVALATAAASLATVEASALDTGTAEPVSVQASTLSVTLAEGASAQGLSSPDFGECESVHCRHLEITLSGAPAGNYTIECWSSLDDEPWYSGSWHWPSSSLWSAGGCWYGNPGQRVWVVVNGEMSNVVTWGQSSPTVEPNPTTPGGTFNAVTAGRGHTCGLKTDATITCWGNNASGQADAPSGTFNAVTAGSWHSCGLKTDATITCWGNNRYGEADAPGGTFSAVTGSWLHTCGLKTDATITCWGDNRSGQADAPSGTYQAVTAGEWHSCGLKTDATITCWGNNGYGRTDAPGGTFSAVTAGGFHTCGLKTDATITCWGINASGRADAPGGTFSAVTAGGFHTCGLRTDATITCWGRNGFGEADAPGGTFNAVTAGWTHTCGLKTDATITCWGDNGYGQADAPGGTFNAVTARGENTCGLKTDATITCWGRNRFGEADAPSGTFNAVTAGWTHTCGLKTDATITCWGRNREGEADAPSGTFNAVTAGGNQTCGLKTDATITCWGRNSEGEADAPSGTFNAVTAGGAHTCGLKTDATIACWGNNDYGQADAPGGTFSAVTGSGLHTCGLKTDATITCWGRNSEGEADAPSGTFNAVTAGWLHSCGLKTDATITCWGRNRFGEADAPSGTFNAVTAGKSHTCGLKTDATITCWGSLNMRTADPVGGGSVASGPAEVSKVTGVMFLPSSVSWTGIRSSRVAWEGVSNATSYEVEWLLPGDGGEQRGVVESDLECCLRFRSPFATPLVWAPLGARVRAVGDGRVGPWSDMAAAPVRLGKVSGIEYRSGSAAWEPVQGAGTYDISWKYGGEDERPVPGLACCEFGIPVVDGKSIRLRVRAVNLGGPGPWSSWKTVSIPEGSPPPLVEGIDYHDGVVYWEPVVGAIHYRVTIRETSDVLGTIQGAPLHTTCAKRTRCELRISVLPGNELAEIRVYAKNAYGFSPVDPTGRSREDWYVVVPPEDRPLRRVELSDPDSREWEALRGTINYEVQIVQPWLTGNDPNRFREALRDCQSEWSDGDFDIFDLCLRVPEEQDGSRCGLFTGSVPCRATRPYTHDRCKSSAFRVRAVNNAGAGEWSKWGTLGVENLYHPPQISRLEVDEPSRLNLFAGALDVDVTWKPVACATSYALQCRYFVHESGSLENVSAADAFKALDRGRAITCTHTCGTHIRERECKVKDVADNDNDKRHRLQFRVSALNILPMSGPSRSKWSDWTSLTAFRIAEEMSENADDRGLKCKALEAAEYAEYVLDTLMFVAAVYTGGLAAATWGLVRAAAKSIIGASARSTVLKSITLIEECYPTPVIALADMVPVLGFVLKVTGAGQLLDNMYGCTEFVADNQDFLASDWNDRARAAGCPVRGG